MCHGGFKTEVQRFDDDAEKSRLVQLGFAPAPIFSGHEFGVKSCLKKES
jgi:hypothetical protein